MTNTPTTNNLPATPNHLAMMIAAVMDSIEAVQLPPLSTEPGFEEYLDNQALLQLLKLAQYHQVCLDVDPSDQAAAAGLLKTMALIERSRTRVTRPTKNDQIDAPKPPRERDFAAEFLKAELLPGPLPAEDLLSRGRQLGISARTLHRAKADLGISSDLHVMPDKLRFWTWALPEHAAINKFDPPKPRPGYTYKEHGTIPFPPDFFKDDNAPSGSDSDSDLSTQTSGSNSDLSTQQSELSTSAETAISA